jgi:transcriptional regulator with XRE-family HTH domain
MAHHKLHKMISISQIRAARALLNWTQAELAHKTGLSLRALNSIERGLVVPRIDNLRFIQEACEKADIEFCENDGVRRKTEKLDVVKFEGSGCIGNHLLDIMQEIRTTNSEVLFNASSEKDFSAIDPAILDDYFAHVSRHHIIERVIVAHGEDYVIGPPSTYRWLQKNNFNHVAYCVYGDNVAYQVFGSAHRVIILRSPSIADMFRRQFEFNWAAAETPWFAKSHKDLRPSEPWSSAKAEAAREWINQSRSRAKI